MIKGSISGASTAHIDLSNVLVAAATGHSLVSIDSVAAGGTGYSVGDIITLTGGTFSIAAQIEVLTLSGSAVATARIFNQGIYTVDPSDPVAQGSVSPAGGSGATFNLTFAANGWTTQRDQTWSGSEREVVLLGSGSGTDSIYIGWRTFSGTGYYNLELHGMTGYSAGLPFSEQPGLSPGLHDSVDTNLQAGAYLLCSNSAISYYININSYRIILVAISGTSRFNAYLGWGNRFGTASEIPYPMCIAGSTSSPTEPHNQSKLTSGLVDPWTSSNHNYRGPMFVYDLTGAWQSVANAENSVSTKSVKNDRCVIPAQTPKGVTSSSLPATPPEDKFMVATAADQPNFGNLIQQGTIISGVPTAYLEASPGTTNKRVLFPAIVVFSTTSIWIAMELDDVFWMSGYNVNTEDRVVVSSTEVYRVFQNCNRTDSYAFLAIREV